MKMKFRNISIMNPFVLQSIILVLSFQIRLPKPKVKILEIETLSGLYFLGSNGLVDIWKISQSLERVHISNYKAQNGKFDVSFFLDAVEVSFVWHGFA